MPARGPGSRRHEVPCEAAHQCRGPDPVADNVADRDADPAVRQLEHVIPVAADLVARRQVAGRDRDAHRLYRALGQQASLQHSGDPVLVLERRVQPRALDARGRAGGSDLEHREVTLDELPRGQRADVQDADQIALDDQRDAEQRADPLLAKDRVQDVRMVDVGDVDRRALGGDPAGEAASNRDPHTLLDLLLDALRGARDQLVGSLFEQQDRDRVDQQGVASPDQKLVEQLVEPEL